MRSVLTPRSNFAIGRVSTPAFRMTPDQKVTLPQVYLHPGQLHVTADPCAIATVLGSCVAVCVFDARLKVGGMNHFLLPDQVDAGADAGRYGPSATQLLLDRMFALGASAETMTARLVGGANVLSAFRVDPPLGMRNAQSAMDVLLAANVLVTACDIGGESGRRLVFSPRDGMAWIKRIGR